VKLVLVTPIPDASLEVYHKRENMANPPLVYRFRIDAFSPESIPMTRLAEYMGDLATLLGNRERVHFVGLESGSTVVVQRVEHEAVPKVRTRINGVRNRTAPEEAIQAYAKIDKRLRDDNATGVVESVEENGDVRKVIEFPGTAKKLIEKFDSISQPGSIDGLLIRVGGKDETVPVYLEEEDTVHHCTSNRTVAKRLSPLLFEVVRVHGVGTWNIDDFGNWIMEGFRINDFEKLDTMPLGKAVDEIRKIHGGFESFDDPIGELNKLRQGTEK
jgi:hypothetical protein